MLNKLCIISLLCLCAFLEAGAQRISRRGLSFFVSTHGDDRGDGTAQKPFASIQAGLRAVREARRLGGPASETNYNINIDSGTYILREPIFIRPEDAGTAESITTLSGIPGKTIISGGLPLENWRPSSMSGIMEADLPPGAQTSIIRQLWVNGKKATRAQTPDTDTLSRILSWDKKARTCRIPKPSVKMPAKIEGMEMIIQQWWAIAFLRIKEIKDLGDSLELGFMDPESRVESEHPWPAPWISKTTGNSPFLLANSLAFLDQPGEWYCDQAARKIYYKPLPGEDARLQAFIPQLENLVLIQGDIDHPVQYLTLRDLNFMHAGWNRPAEKGLVSIQAGMPLIDAYHLSKVGTPYAAKLENLGWIERPAAAVTLQHVAHTSFIDCRFEDLASTGLDYLEGTNEDEVIGNLFYEVGGSAILAGTFSDPQTELHMPFNPSDERRLCRKLKISNNFINHVTTEDWSCVGIGAGFVRDIAITHNEICDVNYTAVSLGWGWTKQPNAMRNNLVQDNYLHHYAHRLYDVAAIYTLSAQPGTLISRNRIDSIYKAPQAHDPHHWFYLYTDEGSSYITVRDNRTPSAKFLQNANGPGNVWENNGPAIANSLTAGAGLEPAWQLLKQIRPFRYDGTPINFDQRK